MKTKVLEISRDKLKIDDVIIERAHKVKPYQNKKSNKVKALPRTIVYKLLNYKNKNRIFRKCNRLKSTSYYINEDFNNVTLAIYKDLCKEVKTLQEKSQITNLN